MTQDIVIAKFGGTSVSTSQNIKTICEIVKKEYRAVVLVVSALSGVTDLLVSLSNANAASKKEIVQKIFEKHTHLIDEVFKNQVTSKECKAYILQQLEKIKKLLNNHPSQKLNDRLFSYGEILSSYLIVQALRQQGQRAEQIIATEFIVTDRNFGRAEFIPELTKKKALSRLAPLIQKGVVPVVTGFIGATEKGETTTFGRGGSDYSASIIGYSLGASEIQIWTDVNGVFSADPRLVESAQFLKEVTYKEASEMAFFGAKVLHPRTLRPAISAHIPVRILNTLNPSGVGTLIKDTVQTRLLICAITSKKNITLITMYSTEMLLTKGFLARIFQLFAKNNISIDIVSVSEVSVSVTLDNDDNLEQVVKELEKFTAVTIVKKQAIVSIIGEGITDSSKTIKKIFDVLDKKSIMVEVISLSGSNINISIVVDSKFAEALVKVLHTALLRKRKK